MLNNTNTNAQSLSIFIIVYHLTLFKHFSTSKIKIYYYLCSRQVLYIDK